MGREIKRVPLDFNFPLDASWHDDAWNKHRKTCPKGTGPDDYDADDEAHDECDVVTAVPQGEGWQLWQTVSDGPITPVFATPEELIEFMSQPVPVSKRPHYDPSPFPRMPWAQGWKRETAESFVRREGWMPSFVAAGGRVLTTDEAEADVAQRKATSPSSA